MESDVSDGSAAYAEAAWAAAGARPHDVELAGAGPEAGDGATELDGDRPVAADRRRFGDDRRGRAKDRHAGIGRDVEIAGIAADGEPDRRRRVPVVRL